MKNLKDNIWIEGFDTDEIVKWNELGYYLKYLVRNSPNDTRTLVYWGKTSDIPEEIAKECVLKMMCVNAEDLVHAMYRRYHAGNMEVQSLTHQYSCVSAKESIQSACNQEYCIIFKK